ncbi:hypothetical protein JCM5353_006945, partial [Sporobolomyces roseus]
STHHIRYQAMLSSVFVTLVATGLVSAAPSPFSSTRISNDVSLLAKRAAPTVSQSSYLQDLFSYQTDKSEKACSVPLADLETCAKGTDQASIAACACSTQTLGDLRSCAAAISTSTKSTQNATEVVVSYNSFVDLCQTEGLATVTGTVAAGESTKSVSRASSTSSVSSNPSTMRPTYDAASTPSSTATVPLLTTGSVSPQVSGVNANAASNTNSAPSSSIVGSTLALFSAVAFAAFTLA